jgi:pectate lyase
MAGLALAFTAQGQSLLPLHEPFPTSYGNGTLMGAGATADVWDIGNTGTSLGAVVTNSAALSHPGLAESSGYGLLMVGTPGSSRNRGATFTAHTPGSASPVLYASFLLNVQAAPANSRLFAALSSSDSGTGPSGVVGVWVDSSRRLLLSKNSNSTPSATNASPLAAGTHLIVLRYKWNVGASDDEVALWVNPLALGAVESGVPTPTVTTTSGSDVSPVQSFWILHPNDLSVAATLQLDEVRVGTTWASVTPTGGPLPPPSQPYITEALLREEGFVVRGTNGTPGGTFRVLRTGNPALPLGEWAPVSTNAFDGSGQFSVTNPVPAGVAQGFYLLLLGGELPPVPVAPTIVTPPASQTVVVGGDVTFTVQAEGTAPLFHQWFFNTNTALAGATGPTLTLTNVQLADAGGYSVVVSNAAGVATSGVATLTVQVADTNLVDFNLYGFGGPTAGGGVIPETDPAYRKVYTAGDFRMALSSSGVKVIEIMNDLNLGWNEVGATNQTGRFRSSTAPSLHPVLLASGVTTVDIQDKNGLTIFSANGATIRHAEFNVKRAHNLIIRNLKFDELWEWDESTKGDYDAKDWDFITIGDGGNCTNVWIDHCTFTKSYDGTVDLKAGANRVTISWCRFLGDDGGPGSFVRRQFDHLETNGVAEAMFDFLRSNGFSLEDLITISRSQKKGHLAGPTEFDSNNADIRLTLHNNYYLNHQDRLPRLRSGNAHVFNVYLDNTEALAAKNLRNARVAAIPGGLGSYKFDVTLNGAISTEDGAVLLEKSHLVDLTSPLRNNQTDPNNTAYTGKIRAADTIHTLNGSTFRGDTESPGSTLVPVPAPIKPFSWNGFASLPYPYPLRDPSELSTLLTDGNTGAGTVTWAKTNWLKTIYP